MLCGQGEIDPLHLLGVEVDLGLPGAMRSDFGGLSSFESSLLQVLLDLLPPWAAGGKILGGVAFNFEFTVGAAIQFVTQLPQPCGEFRTVDGCGIALRPIELARLQSMCFPVSRSQ